MRSITRPLPFSRAIFQLIYNLTLSGAQLARNFLLEREIALTPAFRSLKEVFDFEKYLEPFMKAR